MKTKTLLLSLLAGVFLCFSNVSFAQYHHSGSSSSSGGGSDDDAFQQGDYVVNLGVGFVGSGVGDIAASGASSSVGPAIELSGERALSDHFGLGIFISYQSATSTVSSPILTYTVNPNTGLLETVNYTQTDAYKISLLNFDIRGAYHFSAGAKLDPYLGIALGYCDASATDNETSTEPGYPSTSTSGSIAGVEYGAFGGARYFFTNHIGVWLELQYLHASFSYDGYSSSVNPANVLNLGITFKW